MKPLSLPESMLARGLAQTRSDADKPASPEAWQREMEKAQSAMWFGHQPVGTASRAAAATHGTSAPATVTVPSWRPAAAAPGELAPVDDLVPPVPRGHAVSGESAPATAGPMNPDVLSISEDDRPSLQGPGDRTLPAHPAPRTVEQASAVMPGASLLSCVGTALARWSSSPVEVLPRAESPRAAVPVPLVSEPMVFSFKSAKQPGAAETARHPSVTVPRREADPEAIRVYCQFTADGLMVWIGAAAGSGFNAPAAAAQLQHALARQSQRLAGLVCNGRRVEPDPDFPTLDPHTKEPTWPLEQ